MDGDVDIYYSGKWNDVCVGWMLSEKTYIVSDKSANTHGFYKISILFK